MSIGTRSQRLAQAAYSRIASERLSDDFVSFSKRFPALIHSCGLAQAVAFALSKQQANYVDDLAAVLNAVGHVHIMNGASLEQQARTQPLAQYLRLSRDAINTASWLKRYVEALGEDTN